MKAALRFALAVACLAAICLAAEFELSDEESQKCNGMYSKGSWGGSVDPFILTKIEKPTNLGNKEGLVSFVIFEWRDQALIGVERQDTNTEEIFCFDSNIKAGLCNQTQFGEFILKPNADSLRTSPIINRAIHLDNPEAINYPITKTGYYCVWTYHFSDIPYNGAVEYRNSYGELPGAQIPKLPFYGGLTILYAVIGAFWAFLYVQNRHDILPVQNYITAIVVFLIIEQLITWGYYDYQNRNGNNAGTKALLIVTAILNAGRNSFSFFLLLITCMGYGIVKPTLGKTMLHVRILAITHFVFGVIYGIATLAVTPDSAGPLLLLVIMPLAATLTAFYVWTLNALSATLKDLINRKQSVKAMMYRRLWWCILGSILVIFAFFFFNSFTFARRSDPDFVPNNWKTRWFVLDGWLNLVYLFDIAFIAYLWRPTANNRRFAMSDELAQDDDGNFEIASFGGSLDEEAEEAAPQPPPQSYARAQGYERGGAGMTTQPSLGRQSRPSVDGETIFAVGEDGDKFSDEEDNDSADDTEQRKVLTS
ncbi:MAG: hypothetical protein LQ340_001027 [Diploschistes diacapsis]|nr:MAG: hypothetical protein LQ340_001027 [Diploschistes diacapsis]